MWYPEKIRKRAIGIIHSLHRYAEGQPELTETFIVQKTQQCIQLLSEKLGTKEFLMGKTSPTSIDSVVFSYLSFFWKIPLTHNPIKEFLKSTPNLESYVARILQRYFPVGEHFSYYLCSTFTFCGARNHCPFLNIYLFQFFSIQEI